MSSSTNERPIVFSGTLRGSGKATSSSRGEHTITVRCWPDQFEVTVQTCFNNNHRMFPQSEWTSIAAQINHRYGTTLPEIYPGTVPDHDDLVDLLPPGDGEGEIAQVGSKEPSRSKPVRRPARRTFMRIIEE